MKKLFITDLDGTLLNRESLVSDTSAQIISNLSNRGINITVATARTPATVEPLLYKTITNPPAVVMTGAALWDRQKLQFIDPIYIEPLATEKITATCCRFGINPFIYSIVDNKIVDTRFFGQPTPNEQKFINQRNNLTLKQISTHPHISLSQIASQNNTILIFALGTTTQISRLAEALRAENAYSISAYSDNLNPSISYIEIFAPGVDKASAIKKLKTKTGAQHLTVFGDNLNDLPMMAVADVAIAVENALPQVKEAADIVIGSHDCDSVARYIESVI